MNTHKDFEDFKNFIKESYDLDTLNDIANYGCSTGFGGLIYYKDTTDLYNEYEDAIWDWLYDEAEAIGTTILDMMKDWKHQPCAGEQFKNMCVWACVEQIARELVEESKQENKTEGEDK